MNAHRNLNRVTPLSVLKLYCCRIKRYDKMKMSQFLHEWDLSMLLSGMGGIERGTSVCGVCGNNWTLLNVLRSSVASIILIEEPAAPLTDLQRSTLTDWRKFQKVKGHCATLCPDKRTKTTPEYLHQFSSPCCQGLSLTSSVSFPLGVCN